MADPFVLRWQDEYFAYGTGVSSVEGKQFPVLHSTNLTDWEYVGHALVSPEGLPADAEYWAPAVAEQGGKFYLYYSGAPAGDAIEHRLRVAVADHPAGPFVDTGRILLPDEGFTIDAHPFRDPKDGRWYLYYARDFLDGDRVGTGLAVVPLADDMVTPTGSPQVVLRATADWQIYERDRTLYGQHWSAWHTVEGACTVEHDGTYYCFYSGGNWQTPGYGVSYGTADHPLGPWQEGDITNGPLVLRGTDMEPEAFGPGHNSMTTSLDGSTDYIVYHAWDAAHTARRMFLTPIEWTLEGPRRMALPPGTLWVPS